MLIALLGIGAGWFLFQKRPLLQMPRLLENKYYVDEIYDATLIRPIEVVSREGFWKIFDVGVIDGLLHSIGEAVTEAGRLARYLQAGFRAWLRRDHSGRSTDFDRTVCIFGLSSWDTIVYAALTDDPDSAACCRRSRPGALQFFVEQT